MENIDERDIEAARFERKVLSLWNAHQTQAQEMALKVAVLLLFTYLMEQRESLPWTWADTETPERLAAARVRAMEWLEFGREDGSRAEWQRIPQSALDGTRDLVHGAMDVTTTIRRLDYAVKSLGVLRHSNQWARRVESFVAEFAQGWTSTNGSMVDLNMMTTGELGVRLGGVEPYEFCVPDGLRANFFEVCLRLRAHDVRFRFISDEDGDHWRYVGAAYKFSWGARASANPSEPLRPLALTGLEFAQWYLERGHRRIAVIALPTADLRAKGRRAEMRRSLLRGSKVIGVVEVPARVSGSIRISMLLVASGDAPVMNEPVLLMNGRAVDGLRDEPLDRLARFLSIPFMGLMMRDGTSRRSHDEPLGEVLTSRARKMFGSDSREMPGFFRYVSLEEILYSDQLSLEPSQWIPKRDPLVSSDLLDGRPVFNLLEDRTRACCVYVIGNNGAGKSMLLRQLAEAYVAKGRPVRAVASATSDRFESKLGQGADYEYLGARTSETGTQPRRLGRKLAELMVSLHTDRIKVAAVNRVLEQLSFSGQHYLLPEAAASDTLESVRELGGDELPTNLSGWKLGFQRLNQNTIVPFDHLSTGEQQLLLLTARLVAHAAPGVVFLVDEPETSLHVAWQRALPSVFQTISRDFSCQMVVATHSPILISTARGDDSFRFMAEGGVLEEIGEQASSSVERVLFQGFDTYTENNREVHERCAELVSDAIEFANTEQLERLQKVIEELGDMEQTVKKSVPALGAEVPATHLDLIRRAALAVAELGRTNQAAGSDV